MVLIAAGLGRVYSVHFPGTPDASATLNDREMVIQTTTGGVTSEDGVLAYTRKTAPLAEPPECTTTTSTEATVATAPGPPAQPADIAGKANVADAKEAKPVPVEKETPPPPAEEGGKDACPT